MPSRLHGRCIMSLREERNDAVDAVTWPMFRQGVGVTEVARRLGHGTPEHPSRQRASASLARYKAQNAFQDGLKEAGVTASRRRKLNWDGKTSAQRLRELQTAKRSGAHLELVEFQLQIARMCVVLEDFDVQKFGTDEADLWKMAAILDDLISLGEWHSRQLESVLRYVEVDKLRSKIEKLRHVEGRTEEEKATALHLADRLERKMLKGADLGAGSDEQS